MLQIANGPQISKLWLWRAGPAIHVDVGAMLTWISHTKKRKTRKGTTIDSFCLELHRILWTVSPDPRNLFLYFGLIGLRLFIGAAVVGRVLHGPPVDLGMGDPSWLTMYSGETTSVDSIISTAEDTSGPIQIGSTVH